MSTMVIGGAGPRTFSPKRSAIIARPARPLICWPRVWPAQRLLVWPTSIDS